MKNSRTIKNSEKKKRIKSGEGGADTIFSLKN